MMITDAVLVRIIRSWGWEIERVLPDAVLTGDGYWLARKGDKFVNALDISTLFEEWLDHPDVQEEVLTIKQAIMTPTGTEVVKEKENGHASSQ